MNKKIWLFGLSLVLFFLGRVSAEQPLPFLDENITISMDFQDTGLKNILKALSIQSGLNFIASEAVQERKITLFLDKVPIKQAMDRLFEANNLSYEWDKQANIIVVRDWGSPEPHTITKVFSLKYAQVSNSRIIKEKEDLLASDGGEGGTSSGEEEGGEGITEVVKKLLSASGSVVEDVRTNSLIVTDIPSRIPKIAETIVALDIPVPQIVLEVEMLDVTKGVADEFGVRFPQSILKLDLTRLSRVTSFPFGSLAKKVDFSGTTLTPRVTTGSDWTLDPATWSASHFGPSIFSAINTQLALDFLRTKTDIKVLARPKILTLNNETAEIKITTQEAVGEKKSTGGGESGETTTTTAAERYETGISLRVTPQVNVETGEITMFVMPSVTEATQSTISSSTGVRFWNPEVRTTKSVVKIRDGDTVILGGLIKHKTTETIVKIPILGDIPLFGYLFKHKEKSPNEERELLVFITPRIVKESNIELSQAKKAVVQEREQSVVCQTSRQQAIDNILEKFSK